MVSLEMKSDSSQLVYREAKTRDYALFCNRQDLDSLNRLWQLMTPGMIIRLVIRQNYFLLLRYFLQTLQILQIQRLEHLRPLLLLIQSVHLHFPHKKLG